MIYEDLLQFLQDVIMPARKRQYEAEKAAYEKMRSPDWPYSTEATNRAYRDLVEPLEKLMKEAWTELEVVEKRLVITDADSALLSFNAMLQDIAKHRMLITINGNYDIHTVEITQRPKR